MKRLLFLGLEMAVLGGLVSCSASADRPAATTARGEKVYEERRCGVCHSGSEPPADAPAPPHVVRGPKAIAKSHRFEGSRFQRGWIETFLMEPAAGGAGLPGADVLAIARYLETLRDTTVVPEMPELVSAIADTAEVLAGAVLYKQFACGSCHRMNGEGETIGPDLTGVGARLRPAYMAANLRDPQRIWPTSEMPNFGLMPAQVRSLVAYLSAQQP